MDQGSDFGCEFRARRIRVRVRRAIGTVCVNLAVSAKI
jgi:hypothetical protein